MINSASEFLALAKLKRGEVEINGAKVRIRELNVRDRAEMMKLAKEDPAKCQIFIVRSCVISDSGEPLFNDDGAAALAESAPKVLDEIGSAILKLSGLKDDDPKNA